MKIFNATNEDFDFYSQFESFSKTDTENYGTIIEVKNYYLKCEIKNKPKLKKVRTKKVRIKKSNLQKSKTLEERYNLYKKRAEKKDCKFEISIDEFKNMIKSNCVYCGKIGFSIDRINSSGCYTKDNIQPICKMCNNMKFVFTHESFVSQCKLIASRF